MPWWFTGFIILAVLFGTVVMMYMIIIAWPRSSRSRDQLKLELARYDQYRAKKFLARR